MRFYIFLLFNVSTMFSSEYMEIEDEHEVVPLLINSEKSNLLEETQYISDLESLPLEVKLNIYSKIDNFTLPTLRAVNNAFKKLFAEKEYKKLLDIIKIEKAVKIIREEEDFMDLEDPYMIIETLKALNFLHKHWNFKTYNFKKILIECLKLRYSPEFLTNNGEKVFKEFCQRYQLNYTKRSFLNFCCSKSSEKDRITSCLRRICRLITLTALFVLLLPTIYFHPKTTLQKTSLAIIDGLIISGAIYLCIGFSCDLICMFNPYRKKAKVNIIENI